MIGQWAGLYVPIGLLRGLAQQGEAVIYLHGYFHDKHRRCVLEEPFAMTIFLLGALALNALLWPLFMVMAFLTKRDDDDGPPTTPHERPT